MLNNQTPLPKKRKFDWLAFSVVIIFGLVILTGTFMFVVYSRTKTVPAPMVESLLSPTLINTATLTFTPVPELPHPLPTPTLQIYIVKSGDTLFSIASEFGVSVESIKTANALSSDLIFPDQQLIIPANQSVVLPSETASIETLVLNLTPGFIRYQVVEGDTLESIAFNNGLSLSDLRAANAMVGDTLIIGQFISIPLDSPVTPPPWKFSTIDGGVNQAYPLSLETDRFILHYQPGTFPAQDPNVLIQLEMDALVFLESFTGLGLEKKYDVYVAGSNFGPPNRALRGITFSSLLRTFFLHDATGNADDQRYIATHELTHLFLWNTVGSPSSTMLSEGMAVYIGMEIIKDSNHIPIETFCAAYLQAGILPNVSGSLSFSGHIFDLQNYYSAGCFVKYLVDTYGIDSLNLVYHTGDYTGVYGRSLSALENDWRIYIATVPIPVDLNSTDLVTSVKELENSYTTFFYGFTGSPVQLDAYRELDKARIALLQGNLIEMQNYMNAFQAVR